MAWADDETLPVDLCASWLWPMASLFASEPAPVRCDICDVMIDFGALWWVFTTRGAKYCKFARSFPVALAAAYAALVPQPCGSGRGVAVQTRLSKQFPNDSRDAAIGLDLLRCGWQLCEKV